MNPESMNPESMNSEPMNMVEPTTLEEAAETVLGSGELVLRPTVRRGRRWPSSGHAKAWPRVLDHEPGDLTAIVEAGIRLSELQAELEAHGQMLALDPPGDPTVGACLGRLTSPNSLRATGTARCATS